jgi:hypothetical protein
MPYQITTGKDGKPEVVVSGFDPAKAKNQAQAVETPSQLGAAEAGARFMGGAMGDIGVAAAKGAASGLQELVRTGNIGKAQAAYQQGYARDISANAAPGARMVAKGVRDLAQSVLGNLPADTGGRLSPETMAAMPEPVRNALKGITGPATPRKPGAPDAPILGILPPLPKIQTKSMAEDIGAGLIQGGIGWFLATRGLKGAGGLAMRAPGAATVVEAAAPVAQAAKTATAAPGATGVLARGASKAAKLVLEGAPAGAIVDYAAFDPGESGRISDRATKWINTLPDPLRDAAHNLVLSKPGDTAADARWKNAVEGFMVLGPAAAGVIDSLGYAARAIGRVHQARMANRPPEPPAGKAPAPAPEVPAAAQTVDVTAAPAAPPKAPPKGPAPAAPKAPARATEIAKQYQEMRPRQPLWEKTEVQTQGTLGSPAPTVPEAEAELRTAVTAVDTAIAKASSTVPDVMGPVPAVERGNVMPSYSQVKETPVADIATDPVRLQFKAAGIGKTGTTGSLKSAASYDPLFGKIVSVWRDPQTNQLLVVNGHNRLDLARRSGTKSILTWEIDAATAEEARAIGAMENIAEGQGTPWDAAKIMRDMGINAEEMVRRNIDVTKGVAERGVALSRLPQDVFEQGVTGKLTLDKAVALGSEKLDDAVVRDVAAAATKNGWSAEKILQAMQEAKFAQTSGPSGGGVLPGFEKMFETSNFGTMLDVRTEAFKALREEMVALTSVAREGRKGILESAGNVVNVAGSQAAKGQAQAAVDVFNRVTGYTGPVRDLLNEMAGQVGGKRTAKAVVTENLVRLKAAIEDEMKGPRLPLEQPPAAAVAPSVPSAGTPAPAAPTASEPRTAVQPMGNVAAAAIEPPAPVRPPVEPPRPPEPPRPVDPPAGPGNSDDWVRRFAQELERNHEALIRGDITMEDLMANNFQKVQSPSGDTVYAAATEDLVSGYNAMTKALPDRQQQSGFGLFSAEETATFVQSWFTRHGADQELVTNGLMPLIRGFNEYQVGDLNRAMALADKKQVEASMEAAMWLNSANAEGVNQSERLARLITAANAARTMHTAVMKVTRPWGQLGLEMQMPRDYVIPPATGAREAVAPPVPEPPVAAAIPDVQSLDVGGEIVREIQVETARPIEETFSDDLRAAAAGGEITPKAQAEADTLAQTLVSAGAEPSMREKTWGSFDVLRSTSSGDLGPLLMLRTNNLISSGVTANTNFINGVFNLARLPLSQVAGAVATGELKRAMYSMMMFQQYWMNLSNAFRVAGHSLKAGRSLMNMDVSTLDWMDRAAAKDAQGELLNGPEARTGWTINTVDMGADMAKKPLGMVINALWKVLGTGASRLAIGIDTFNSTLAGYAYEHVRHLPRGMDLATERGMAEFSPEAWKFAQDYANARTQATMRDAVINGKNLADVAMESPNAKDFMNAINFTDDVWSEMQTRSLSQGISIGESQGLKGKELTDFAQKYVDEGQAQHRLANFALNGPVPFGRLGSLPGEAMATLSQAKLVGPIFKFIQPFQRVPSNIIKSAMRGTPAAVFVDTFWRDIVSEDAFTRDRAIGEVALGSAVLSLVAMGSAMGYVRFNGGGPLDPAAKEKWTTIEGRMPYSVQVWDEAAGKWSVPTSMQAVEPYATLFGAIGDYTDIANSLSTEQRNRLGSSLVMTLARASTSGVLSKTYFQGFNEIYEAMFNPSKIMTGPAQRDPLARFMSRIAASMVPYSSALRAGRRETDPIARTVNPSDVGGLMGFWQETLDEIRNAVPGWSNELPARRDWINGAPILTMGIMGSEVIPPEMPWLQAAMQFTPLAAFRQGRQSLGPVHEEMGMLSGKGTNFMGPRAADFGPEMRLTPGELEDYITTFATVKDQYGRTFEQAAVQLIQSAQYQSWPVDGPSSRDVSLRAAAIQAEIQVFKKLAKEQYKVSTPKGQLIAAEEAAAEGRKLEANYIRQYGMDNNPQPAQAGGAWSPTPR